MEKWDLGTCGMCGQKIELSQLEAEERQSRVNAAIEHHKARVYDEPVHGTTLIIPLPPYPCGHVFEHALKCYKGPDGKFRYSE